MLISVVQIFFSVYILTVILLYVFQREFIYFPSAAHTHNFVTEKFASETEDLEVVVLNGIHEKAIIYFGGNAESVVYNAPGFIETFPNRTLYLVNYRGYGGSSGSPSEAAFYVDASNIYDLLEKRHTSIAVIGRSLGSGVATYLAATKPIDELILVTPFDSIERIAQDRFPVFPIPFLLKDKFDSISRIKLIRARTLVILAEQDEVIPLKYSKALIDAFQPQQVMVETIAGTGHNNLSATEKYYLHLQNFMQ
jgi:fermentation-respiration switch protein FrsA (DUF1100 family)